jgi:hypothetical protein
MLLRVGVEADVVTSQSHGAKETASISSAEVENDLVVP